MSRFHRHNSKNQTLFCHRTESLAVRKGQRASLTGTYRRKTTGSQSAVHFLVSSGWTRLRGSCCLALLFLFSPLTLSSCSFTSAHSVISHSCYCYRSPLPPASSFFFFFTFFFLNIKFSFFKKPCHYCHLPARAAHCSTASFNDLQ